MYLLALFQKLHYQYYLHSDRTDRPYEEVRQDRLKLLSLLRVALEVESSVTLDGQKNALFHGQSIQSALRGQK